MDFTLDNSVIKFELNCFITLALFKVAKFDASDPFTWSHPVIHTFMYVISLYTNICMYVDARVGVEYGTIIMRCRNEKGWTQRDLAQVVTFVADFNFKFLNAYIMQKINEKPSVVVEFESGKAVVNHAILGKMERALGMCNTIIIRFIIIWDLD